MSTTQPQSGGSQAAAKHHNPWVWISAALVLVAAGLLIWGLSTKSDLDKANDDVASLQAQLAQTKQSGGTAATAAKTAVQALAQQLGVTNQDLAATQQQLQTAQDAAKKAEQQVADAKDAVAGAKDKTQAQLEQAQAEAQAAGAKVTVAADCGKTALSAIGTLFEGESVRSQAPAVMKQLQGIAADCKTALAGT